jgi:hypothetical protein
VTTKYSAGLPLAALLGLLAGCTTGSMDVRLEPPALQVESLQMEGDTVHLGVRIHNRNDHALMLQSAAMEMRVNNHELFNATRELALDIGPRGRELVRLNAPALPAGAKILDAWHSSPGASFEFELSSEVVIDGQKDAKNVEQGFLYPVPGQPGHFR